MTVIDTSGVVDFLLGVGAAAQVRALMAREGALAAPDVLVFEALAVMRRHVLGGVLASARAQGAAEDLAELPIELFPSLALAARAFELHRNLTIADALFVALAEQLREPLATKDRALAREASKHSSLHVLTLEHGA